jgi:hypothetical protein
MSDPMEMNPNPLKEVFDELFTLLEVQETQIAAVLQLLKDTKVTTDQKLASYLEQAGNASNVKWRAARLRMEYLLSPVQKELKEKDKEKDKDQDRNQEKPKTEQAASENSGQDKDAHPHEAAATEKNAGSGNSTGNPAQKDTPNQEPQHQ